MRRFVRFLCAGFFLGTLLLVFCWFSLGDGLLHIYYLDIGQGDGILIRTPASEYILVDGGPDDSVLQEMSKVMPFYERTIDLLVLSHPHADHMNGLIDVLERYDVRAVMMTGIAYRSAAYGRFLDLIEKESGIRVVLVDGSVDYRFGNVIFDVTYPLHGMQGMELENLNNSSAVFRLLYGDRVFYFSGDLEEEGEENLLEYGGELRADVLKVGHHGSRTSSTEEFLDLVLPEWAVISCGVDNQFDHPHPETVRHLQERGIRIYRTDLDGTIEVRSDGEEIEFVGDSH